MLNRYFAIPAILGLAGFLSGTNPALGQQRHDGRGNHNGGHTARVSSGHAHVSSGHATHVSSGHVAHTGGHAAQGTWSGANHGGHAHTHFGGAHGHGYYRGGYAYYGGLLQNYYAAP